MVARALRCLLFLLLSQLPGPNAHAQTIEGTVVDDRLGSGIPSSLVTLLDADGQDLSVVVADSVGRFRITTPEPGSYLLAAEGLGYETTRSPLLSVSNPDGTYGVDLALRASPLGLPGFEVTADRFAEIDRRLQQLVGRSTVSMRMPPIRRPDIESHIARGHDVEDLMRWSSVPSLEIRTFDGGPCFLIRAGGMVKLPEDCVGVYLNGFRLGLGITPGVPLEPIETILVVMPGESLAYPAGAVLLYTAAWIS